MTYREIQTILNHQLTQEQLDQEATIAIIGSDGVEVFGMCDFVDPKDERFEGNQDVRDCVYLDEVDGSILDAGHPYMTTITQ